MDIDLAALRALERERDISLDVIIPAIEQALLLAYHRTEGAYRQARVDLDRKSGFNTRWASGARAAAQREAGAWTLEVSLPAAGENAESIDPLNGIAGAKPTPESPWFFNLCRQRIREKERELSAFSPTGTKGFHDLLKFGELIIK